MRKISAFILVSSLLVFSANALISFENPDLNLNDEVIFTVKNDVAGTNQYKSLFFAKLKDGQPEKTPQVITCYPEQMELLNGGNTLQIRNRYGIARYESRKGILNWIETFSELPENTLSVVPYSISPDGKYLCYIDKTSLYSGNLVLENSDKSRRKIIAENVLNTYENLPLKWSPNSNILVYEKDNTVYFCNPDAVLRGVEIDEKYRKIGRGTINSLYWASAKYLAYVDDYILYKINAKELYTLGLYSGIIGRGTPMGRLPFQFNSQTDKVSSNHDVSRVVITQNGRLFTYLAVQNASYDYMDVVYSRPYIESSASLAASYVFWDNSGSPILWQEKLPYDGSAEKASVFKIGSAPQHVLEITDSGKPFISPNNTKIALFAGEKVYVYDINTWKRIAELSGEKVTSALWVDDTLLYVGGEKTIRRWNIVTDSAEIITISSAETGYWNDLDYSILADARNKKFYKYNTESGTWSAENTSGAFQQKKQNGKYRVFIGATENKKYENALYTRYLSKRAVTIPFFKESTRKTAGTGKVALVFDLYDNADGLPKILSALKKYNVRGNFSVNGEFIRRYPYETRQIAANGYNCSSMFFSTTDLTDNSFVINEDFVRSGLARNEDEFYACTKKELSLYWHAPYYEVTPKIIKYGNNAGYNYVYVSCEPLEFTSIGQNPEAIISRYVSALKKTNGGIIPVTGGFSGEHHSKPLYNYLDVLISVLIDSGYELVDLTDL